MRILINNIHSTNSTCLVKLLKKLKGRDIEIWGTDVAKAGYIAASLMVDRYFQSPEIEDGSAFLEFLQNLCDEYKIDMIIVSSDKEVRFMSKYKDLINPNINIIVPNANIVDLFSDKLIASQEIQKLGISIPPICENLFGKNKIIFRKRVSVSSKGIYIVDLKNQQTIENHFHEGWFAQEYIEGKTFIVDILSDKYGTPKLIIPREKIEVQNASAFRSKLINHRGIIDACQKIYKNFTIPGLSNIEFIEKNGEIFFIEINLRFGGSASAGIKASFNYLEQYIDHFYYGKELDPIETYMNYVAWNSVVSRYYEEKITN